MINSYKVLLGNHDGKTPCVHGKIILKLTSRNYEVRVWTLVVVTVWI